MEQKFRKVVVIFIDILGSQSRENFDEWWNFTPWWYRKSCKERDTRTTAIYSKEVRLFRKVFVKMNKK